MKMSSDPIVQAFAAIGKTAPQDENVCVYHTGLLDSAELLQLLLEIELETEKRLDLASLMEGAITLARLRAEIEGGI